MSKIKTIFTIKRGCTEFTNAHKEYGEIGENRQLHQGPEQPQEWRRKEEKYFGENNDISKAFMVGLDFNLGELIILKNWIKYAQLMGDPTAKSVYGEMVNINELIIQRINSKKES